MDGQRVVFRSSDPDGTIASYAWTFGDGASGAGVTASHTYAAGGTYPVSLTVTDNGWAARRVPLLGSRRDNRELRVELRRRRVRGGRDGEPHVRSRRHLSGESDCYGQWMGSASCSAPRIPTGQSRATRGTSATARPGRA